MNDPQQPMRPSLRPRLSLLSAILLMTIAGMAIVLVQLWREVGPLRDDNRRLRDEVGELTISDPSKIHAIEVRMKEPLIWKFHVWVPEGQKARVKDDRLAPRRRRSIHLETLASCRHP
jgi:hypothetical protein